MTVVSPRTGRTRNAWADRTGRLGGLTSRVAAFPALREPGDRRRILRWLGAGLLVRLLVMPFAFSSDFTAVYWRAHLIAYEGVVFDSYMVNMGAHYLHALSLRLLAPLLPPPEAIWTDPWVWGDAEALGPQVSREFASAPDVFQTLFALKLPYLAFDLAAGVLLLVLVAGVRPDLARRAWAFWMLSPIALYACYLFGRYEAFPVALILGALLLVERERPWTAALLLGAAITMRSYPILLVPAFALIAVRGLPRQAAWVGVALAPVALVMGFNRVLGGSVGEFARLQDFSTGNSLFTFSLATGGRPIYLFFLALFLLYGVLAGRCLGWWGSGQPPVADLWVWLLVVHALLFTLAGFSPHYFTWITPFVALALARRPAWRGILWIHLVQVAIVLVIADLNGWGLAVFAPLAPDLLAAPAQAIVTPPALAAQLDGLLTTAFVALMVLFTWPALTELAGRPLATEPLPDPAP